MSTYISAADFSLTAENETAFNKIVALDGYLSSEQIGTRNSDGTYCIGDPNEIENFFEGDVQNTYLDTLETLVSLCTAGSYLVIRDYGPEDGWCKIWKDAKGIVHVEWKMIENPFENDNSELS